MVESLATFIAVAAAGSFSKVARAKSVAVSSIARQIDALEAELATTLFRRSSRKLLLTDAGELFLPRAKAIVGELASAKEQLSDVRKEPRGVLTITAPGMFGRQHVVPALAEFLRLYPLLDVELHADDEIVDLTARRMDIAIRMGELAGGEYVSTQLAVLHRIACASPLYIARRGRPATPKDLLDHECLTTASRGAPTGWWRFAGGAPLAVHGRLRCDDTGALLQAALAGIGIVHLASWMLSDHIVGGRLVPLFPPPKKPSETIRAVRLPGRSNNVNAQLLTAHLRKAFGTPAYWDKPLGFA